MIRRTLLGLSRQKKIAEIVKDEETRKKLMQVLTQAAAEEEAGPPAGGPEAGGAEGGGGEAEGGQPG